MMCMDFVEGLNYYRKLIIIFRRFFFFSSKGDFSHGVLK